MDAFDEILNKLPSDIGGSTADNGFTFQKNWALMKLLELEESGKSYTIIFDYQDDILVLDSDEEASAIDFYQIKTSVNYWTPSTLCRKEKDAEGKLKKSFLGKLIEHFLKFEKTRDVYFVTDNYLSKNMFDTKSCRQNIMPFAKLYPKTRSDIQSKIQEELGVAIENEYYNHLYIIQNQLHHTDSTDMLIGKITTFLQRKLGNSDISPRAFYDAMFAEVTKRNDYKGICSSKEEILSFKAMSKKQFANYIRELENFKSFDFKCQSIINNLHNGANFKQQMTIKKYLENNVKNEYFQYDNIEFQKLSNCIKTVIKDMDIEDDDTFWSYGNKILTDVKFKYSNPLSYDDDFTLALIFYLL